MIRRVLLGVAAGLLGGTAIGLLEALFLLGVAASPGDYVALFFAVMLYGAIGAGVGLTLGVALALAGLLLDWLDDALVYTLAFVGTYEFVGVLVTRAVVDRWVFAEQGLDGTARAVVLGCFASAGVVGLWLVPIFLTRTPFKILLKARGTVALYGAIALLSAVFSFAPARVSPEGTMSPERPLGAPAGAPNVVIFVVESLRADALGVYGASVDATPNLDALAKSGVIFEAAFAHAGWTRPSVASLLTSMVPTSHTTTGLVSALPEEVDSLAEVLAQEGYVTGGLPGSPHLTRSFNFHQGFDYFRFMAPDFLLGATESASQLALYQWLRTAHATVTGEARRIEDYYQPADVVLERARAFVEAQPEGQPWLLVVHLMEPHEPWFRRPFNGKALGRGDLAAEDPGRLDRLRALYAGDFDAVEAGAAPWPAGIRRQLERFLGRARG